MFTSKVSVFIQFHEVMIASAPSLRKRNRGIRLTKKARATAVLTWETAQSGFRGRGSRVVKIGYANSKKIMIKLDDIISDEECIAATWICTKSFWFLRPMDELLSFRSRPSEPWGPTKVTEISSLRCWRASLGG